jgi:hypothetical protein
MDDAFGVVNDAFKAMLSDDDCDTKVMHDSLQDGEDLFCSYWIECARWLIEEKYAGIHHEGCCYCYTLLLAS